MTTGWLRLGFACLLAGATAGCGIEAFTYTIDRYNTIRGVHVRLGCDDTYEVFDRKADGLLLVATNPVNEALACGRDGDRPRAERQRRIAAIYLEETTSRPLCRLGADRQIADYLREFTYTCPGPARAERRAAGR